ncbi:MAG: SEL1-like repeat protein [Deltaproteobacteria bacterium]|nr:SEL1-like repeat protein [Deltaproteobacteria bacterium]
MKISTLLAAILSIAIIPSVRADVRDDYRLCERNFLSKLRRGVPPSATTTEEEYCLGLGYWFQSGHTILPHDPEKSAFWHRKAAEHGSAPAKVALAYYYEKGYGVQQDVSQAVRLYQEAADQGDASALFNLGRLKSLGRGVSKNEAEAKRLFDAAAQKGSTDAKVDARKTRQYEELERPARETFQQAYAAFKANDYAKALQLYQAASQAGNASADVALGQMYRQGLGVPVDELRATQYYQSAALRGHARAQAYLGLSYQLGEGTKEDWAQALEWFKKSASQFDAVGLFNLGRVYQFGMGVPQNRQTAVYWFEKAHNQGDAQSGFFAYWLRDPKNCLGYIDDPEREKFAGICADPKGVTFHNSKERRAWLVETLSKTPVEFFGNASSYAQSTCQSIGADFRGGNCYGHGGILIDPFSNKDRYGNSAW